MNNQTHFDKIADDYKKASDSWAPIYAQIESVVSQAIKGKSVLDIGNGGYFPYATQDAKSVTVLDISPKMLERINQPNIIKKVGNALELDNIKNESCDIILYSLCIHHIQGKTHSESMNMLNQLLSRAYQKLKPGGQIIIAEPTTSGFYYVLQRALFQLTKFVLGIFNIPMIFFHHAKEIQMGLAQAFSQSQDQINLKELRVEGWVDPMGGSFPGLIKIPAAACPTRYYIITATKA